ncbi:perlwapin-like [Haliotis rubra]|uniref:perlwapin-like n=1 Tax=Haliotis rubra TaxID=36100 RepID=UPI001EE5FF1A|nr:perlwapin-like [Haliotis rubra]
MAGLSCVLAILVLTTVVSVTHSNELPTSCAAVLCGEGTVCKLQNVDCVKAPCPRCIPKNKPGSCPVPKPDQFGISIAECSTDVDCEGDLKCCGSCPKECTTPVTPIDLPGPNY